MKQAIFIINSLQSGGAERVVATQANYLQKTGISVTVIFLRKWISYELNPDIQRIYLTENKSFAKTEYLTKMRLLSKKLDQVLEELYQKGEVVLLTSHLLYAHVITHFTKYAGQAIYVMHNLQEIVPFSKSMLYKRFVRRMYREKQIAAISEAVEAELIQVYGMKKENIHRIPNPMVFVR